MRLLHELAKIHASFDDPHLVSRAGLVAVMALAQSAGLAGEHVRITRPCGVNARLKIPCLVAGMAAGPDGIDDMDLLRHGAMPHDSTQRPVGAGSAEGRDVRRIRQTAAELALCWLAAHVRLGKALAR